MSYLCPHLLPLSDEAARPTQCREQRLECVPKSRGGGGRAFEILDVVITLIIQPSDLADHVIILLHSSTSLASRSLLTHLTCTTTENAAMTVDSDVLTPQYSPEQLEQINKQLDGKSPREVLAWAIDNIDGLYQTTAFGL